jgi:hypothetical protein
MTTTWICRISGGFRVASMARTVRRRPIAPRVSVPTWSLRPCGRFAPQTLAGSAARMTVGLLRLFPTLRLTNEGPRKRMRRRGSEVRWKLCAESPERVLGYGSGARLVPHPMGYLNQENGWMLVHAHQPQLGGICIGCASCDSHAGTDSDKNPDHSGLASDRRARAKTARYRTERRMS